MSEERPGLDPQQTAMMARIIHTGLVLGVVTLFGVMLLLVSWQPAGYTATETSGTLKIVGYGLLFASVVASGLFRGRIEPRRRGTGS
jgi:uncharacterized membrane protein